MVNTKMHSANHMDERLLLRVEEAAALLAVGRATAYLLIATGELPCVRIGRSVRVPLADLRAWIGARATSGRN